MDDLDALIERLQELIDLATEGLIADLSKHAEFQEIMAELLTRYHMAAYLVGADASDITPAAREKIVAGVAAQLAFLERFVLDIQGAAEFEAGWAARARSYANSVKVPYWTGRVKVLPLPALPGDGTTACGQSCKCEIVVENYNAERGDADVFWRLNPAEHCQGCLERASQWNPIRIRGNEIQI